MKLKEENLRRFSSTVGQFCLIKNFMIDVHDLSMPKKTEILSELSTRLRKLRFVFDGLTHMAFFFSFFS